MIASTAVIEWYLPLCITALIAVTLRQGRPLEIPSHNSLAPELRLGRGKLKKWPQVGEFQKKILSLLLRKFSDIDSVDV